MNTTDYSEERKLLERRVACEKRLEKILGDTLVSVEARGFLKEHLLSGEEFRNLCVVSPKLFIFRGDRHEYGNGGGTAMFSQLFAWFDGQFKMREWQWRDRWDARNDRAELFIREIGKIEVAESLDQVNVEVELLNNDGGHSATFVFTASQKEPQEVLLAEKDRMVLGSEFEGFIEDVLAEKMKAYSRRSVEWRYQRPNIKQQEVRLNIGMGVFITEEQIDHRGSTGKIIPQLRYELYVVDKLGLRNIYESHAYEEGNNSALISIVHFNRSKVEINTQYGKKELRLV